MGFSGYNGRLGAAVNLLGKTRPVVSAVALLALLVYAAIGYNVSSSQEGRPTHFQPTAVASSLADLWLNGLEPMLFRTEEPVKETHVVLAEARLLPTSSYCYCRFRYNGSLVVPMDDFALHCNSTRLRRSMNLRSTLYANLFSEVLKSRPSHFSRPFQFYVDLTDGSRNNPELARKLKLPVLSLSAATNATNMIAVPDPHFVFGLLSRSRLSHAIPFGAEGFALAMEEVYVGIRDSPVMAWEIKRNATMYRGACSPTLDSDTRFSNLWTRSALCNAYGSNGTEGFNIGVLVSRACENSTRPYCTVCRYKCSSPKLSRAEQASYKYQLSVDGIGASYDGTVWKLLSNSAVIFVHDNVKRSMGFKLFFYPLLKPFKHYIPSSVDGVAQAVHYCWVNDSACKTMAIAARRTMRQISTLEFMLDYLYTILKWLHDVDSGLE